MGRWPSSLAGLLGIVTLFAGCAANRPGNPFAANSDASKNSAATGKAAANNPEVADRKSNPRGRSAPRTERSFTETESERAIAGRGQPATPSTPQNSGHDPQTLAYIEQELQDATPEERATQTSLLQGLHPDAVRSILRSRRLALNSTRKRTDIAGQRPEIYGQSAIQTASADAPVGDRGGIRRVNSGEGLGAVTAWPRPGDGSRNPSAAALAGTIDTESPEITVGPSAGAAPPPLGHSSGYRVDPENGNPTASGYAMVRPGPVTSGRVTPAAGQLAPGQYSLNPAGASLPGAAPRGSAIKPAAVAVGTPMSAGIAPAGQYNAGAAAGPPADAAAREQLARYISLVESEAFELQPGETEADKLTYIEKQVHLRMLYLMSGQQERALQAIPGLDPADQEFWQQTFWGLTNYFDTNSIPSAPERAAQTVTQMTNAVLRLQEKARLELRNVTFCHKISSFGNYEKYPRDEFSPGQEVLLYAEVANIHSEPIPDGKFRTNLKSTLEIYRHGPQGELVERVDLPETVDVCRTHRRDYFHSYQFTIPAKLALGPHVLKLSVEDQLSRRVGTYTLNFMVK